MQPTYAPSRDAARHRYQIEFDVLEGLEDIAADELDELEGGMGLQLVRPGALSCIWQGDLRPLLGLRGVVAASIVLSFAVPRPKALLGHQHFTAITSAIDTIAALHQPGSFKTLRLSAAGEDSAVMQRLHSEIAAHCGLRPTHEDGDLLLRLRRSPEGWEAVLRISPRPLATRAWRVCNFAGAPNASLAYAMARLTIPHPADRVLNLCCGSGTLLVERCLLGPAQWVLGCDTSQDALACARANFSAAGIAKYARLEMEDVTHLPVDDASVDVILADLPFGQLSGSHRDNERLYPLILAEASRVAMPGARMVLLTHEIRLLEQAAAQHAELWQLHDIIRVRSSGMTPGIFLLERREERQ